MIYLDYAATHPLKKKAKDKMLECIDKWENSNSGYSNLEQDIERVRERVCEYIGVKEGVVVFNSGGCEGNSCINKYITTNIEHKSILNNPTNYPLLKVNSKGIIESLKVNKPVVAKGYSIQYVNNEIGVKQDIKGLIEEIRKDPFYNEDYRLLFHSDMVQALGKIPINVSELGVDFATFSGHKIGAPKGIGFMYIKDPKKFKPLIYGGSQEFGLRGGTSNYLSIMALGECLDNPTSNITTNKKNILNVLDKFGAKYNGIGDSIINWYIDGIDSYLLCNILCCCGVYCSNGSACNGDEPSYVLKAIGKESGVRFSWGNELVDVNELEKKLKEVLDILKEK